MNHFLFRLCLGGFLILPIILLGIRFFRRTWMPWWLLIVLIPPLSWLLVNGTILFYYDHLSDLVSGYANPPEDLVRRLTADGAKRVFGLFFGWLYGIIYCVPFLAIYGIIRFAQSR